MDSWSGLLSGLGAASADDAEKTGVNLLDQCYVITHHAATADKGGDDTEYKKAVLQLVSSHYAIEHASRLGELELVILDGTTVQCDLVLMQNWKVRLPNEFISQ